MQKKELHIVYIITKLELGGAQKVCLALFNGLTQSGHTALLISGAQGALVEKVQHNSFVYLLPTLTREITLNGFYNEFKNFIQLTTHLKKLKKEYPNLIVHTHSTKAGLIGRWAGFFAGIKNRIHTVHGYAFHPHQNKIIWLGIYSLELLTSLITSHFICVSSADMHTGVKLFPNFKKKYSIIRAAIDWDTFQPQEPAIISNEKNKFVIGTIACFKKQKNLTDLIQAFNKAYKENKSLRLEIIGDGILRPELEQLIQSYHLTDVVILHGWQNNVAPLMLSWNAFALTSLWEGLPCALVEARLLKLPVLSYNTGGIHDVIIDGKNGFIYKQKDWQSLAQGILKISTNKELYQKLRNYPENLTDFNNRTMVKKHINLYSQLF